MAQDQKRSGTKRFGVPASFPFGKGGKSKLPGGSSTGIYGKRVRNNGNYANIKIRRRGGR